MSLWIWPPVASQDLRLHVAAHATSNDRPRHAEQKQRRKEATKQRRHEARKQRTEATSVAAIPQWLRRRYRLLFRLRVGAHFPLELPLRGFRDVTGKLLGTSGLPRECLGVLRGRPGKAFGSFGGVLGGFWELLEPLETPLGASGASQGGSWVLP